MTDYDKLNIYQKIMKARVMFQEEEVKKSGKNDFQGFQYLELEDIVPPAVHICEEVGLYSEVQPNGSDVIGFATMKVVNVHNPEEQVMYKIRSPTVNPDASINAKLQDTGRIETYLRRYLYMLFLDIAVPDEVDKSSPKSVKAKKTTSRKVSKKPVKKETKTGVTAKKETKTETKKATKNEDKKAKKTVKDLDDELSDDMLNKIMEIDPNMKMCIERASENNDVVNKQALLNELTEMRKEKIISPIVKSKLRDKLIATT